MRVGENNRKDGQSTTIFSMTNTKTSIQIRMSDEKSRNTRKRMWKITSGVSVEFFSKNIALKRPYNK